MNSSNNQILGLADNFHNFPITESNSSASGSKKLENEELLS